MEFSIFALPTFYRETDGDPGAYFRRLVDFLVSSEELGYDGVWANEHHFHPYGGLVPSPAVLLSAVAARTKRVRLGTSVVVLPIHQPLEIAEQLAMVDLLSSGRLELGIGRGFVPFDYATAGIPMEEGKERTAESLEVILKAWTGRFSHHGKFFNFDDIELWPPVQQKPHPPVWIACSGSPDSFEWTGTMGYNLLTVSSLRPMNELATLVRTYHDAWNAAGHAPTDYRYATHFQVIVDEDRARARQAATEAIPRYGRLLGESIALFKGPSGRPPGRLEDGFSIERWIDEGRILCGTPEDIVATLKRAREELGITGVDGAYYFGGVSFETAQRSLRLFAEAVIPQMRAWEVAEGTAPPAPVAASIDG